MRPQSQQPAGSADSAQPISQATNQPGQVTQDSRPPVIVGYPQAPPLNGREGNLPPAPPVLNPLGGVNLPNQRLGPKFNAMKGNMPNMPLTPNFDLPLPFAGPPRPPYNGQFFFFPMDPCSMAFLRWARLAQALFPDPTSLRSHIFLLTFILT